MGLHKPFDRHFVVIGGNVMTSGGSLQLAKGQLGIFDTTMETINGQTAISSFAGKPKNRDYQFKVGNTDLAVTRSQSNKSFSTFPFKMSEVLDVRVSAPKYSEQKVDEVVVGYNGIDAGTSISFTKGDRKEIFIRLSGEAIGMMGFPGNYVDVSYVMAEELCDPRVSDCTTCDDCTDVSCTPIILNAIEFLKSYDLRGGVKMSDFVEITPVKSCTTSPTYSDTAYSFFTLTVTDIGDEESLALVQAQYPSYTIVRKERNGVQSVYEFLALSSATPAAFATPVASLIKGCAACPTGYLENNGGYLYAISIVDGGFNAIGAVDNIAGAVAGSAIKSGQNGAVGFYTVILSAKLSAANLAIFLATTASYSQQVVTLSGTSGTATIAIDGSNYTATFATDLATTAANFVTTNAAAVAASGDNLLVYNLGTNSFTVISATNEVATLTAVNATGDLDGDDTGFTSEFTIFGASSTVEFVNIVADVCDHTDAATVAWVELEGCTASTEEYTIVLPDDECGTSRLTELQAAYPDLTIAIETGTTLYSSQIVTLSGTSGTATITIDGTGYTATFDTSLALTAQNFVNANAAAVAATGDNTLEYISDSNTFKIIGLTADVGAGYVTAVNATGNLDGDDVGFTAITTVSGGCQTKYTTTVITNVVCPECDPIYLDYYTTTAPANFDVYSWTKVEPSPDYSTDCLCGIKFKGKVLEVHPDECLRDTIGFADSSVQIEVSGGYITEIREAIGLVEDDIFAITYLSRWIPRTHLGGNLYQFEDMSRQFFTGEDRHEDIVARLFKGEESSIRSTTQYIDYAIDIERNTMSQGMAGRNIETNTYHFLVEVGRHTAVELLMNKVAAAAGLNGVMAYAV
jgi:hypothetical protein